MSMTLWRWGIPNLPRLSKVVYVLYDWYPSSELHFQIGFEDDCLSPSDWTIWKHYGRQARSQFSLQHHEVWPPSDEPTKRSQLYFSNTPPRFAVLEIEHSPLRTERICVCFLVFSGLLVPCTCMYPADMACHGEGTRCYPRSGDHFAPLFSYFCWDVWGCYC